MNILDILGCRRFAQFHGFGDSVYDGVQIGAVTFSYYRMPIGQGSMLMYLKRSGIRHIELMGYDLEVEAGAPIWKCPWDQTGPEQEERAAWRHAVDLGAYRDVRAKYDDAGIGIHGVKPDIALDGNEKVADAELDWCFQIAKIMGAKCLTREVPNPRDLAAAETGLRRIAKFCDKYDMLLGFHNHTQIDKATYDGPLLDWSDKFRINFDIGHYVAANEDDPLDFIRKYHDKIFSIHVKDRTTKARKARTTVFGEGDAPLKAMFALLQKEGWSYPCDIEMEYIIPVGSDALHEVDRARRYCRGIIAAR